MILVTELTRWGRSMLDLFYTLPDLHAWDGSLVAQTEFQFELCSAPGTRIAPLLAALAEFERDWLRERGAMFRGCEHSWLKANRIGK